LERRHTLNEKKPLSPEEEVQLAELLSRVTWPVKQPVFRGLVGATVSTPIELCVFREQSVLMFYRKDEEYNGYHIPGTVLRDNEDVPTALNRLIVSEVVGGNVGKVRQVGWMEVKKGTGEFDNPTRHEISLLHYAYILGEYKGSGEFFPVNSLPSNTLPHHRQLISTIWSYNSVRLDLLDQFGSARNL
jgi:ADP-ribose pyrophosphatase YjhB (NUDIX family)